MKLIDQFVHQQSVERVRAQVLSFSNSLIIGYYVANSILRHMSFH